jgi:hypothetical protein
MLGSTVLSAVSKPPRISDTALQPAHSLGKKRKADDKLSRLLSKAKRGKVMTCATDRLDEVERYLANNHCRYSTSDGYNDYY